MMTGDHIETARETAVKAGIITPDEMFEEGVVISSEQFRNNIGPIERVWDPIDK
jgi:magnesium-transporting ATPase (P-type)